MTIATISEIKKALQDIDSDQIKDLCLRLAKYKKENKELLNYLLFEAQDEPHYIAAAKREMESLFKDVPASNVYFVKKSLRKIVRFANRQIKYSGIPETELELRIYFCACMREAGIPMKEGTVIYNIYNQQLTKVYSVLAKLPEDLQADYQRETDAIAL